MTAAFEEVSFWDTQTDTGAILKVYNGNESESFLVNPAIQSEARKRKNKYCAFIHIHTHMRKMVQMNRDSDIESRLRATVGEGEGGTT